MNSRVASQQTRILDGHVFQRVQRIAEDVAGLSIPDSKLTMVQSRLLRRLEEAGYQEFEAYIDHIESETGAKERALMISSLTTNVSHFFREQHHFDLIEEEVRQKLLGQAQSGKRVRIWSAGCSTGQEPYSLAITLLEIEPRLKDLDVKILATDIDTAVLSHASRGRYEARSFESIEEKIQAKYFKRNNNNGLIELIANDALREIISFRQLNLMDPWPMRGKFDAILCRNVVIYFSENTQESLWPRFAERTAPKGLFFLGHSERMQEPNRFGFELAGVTSYRRLGSSE